ncbi:MAG: hypothetical protein AAB546_00720 [Patescibacteria group bacterium]
MNSYIKRVCGRIKNWATTEDNIGLLFRDLRLYIEVEQKEKEYPLLYFFTNWCLHPKMDRKQARELLEELTTACHKYDLDGDLLSYLPNKLHILFIEKLKDELLSLLKTIGCNYAFVGTTKKWYFICYHLFFYLVGKPIVDNNENKKTNKPYWIKSFSISIFESSSENVGFEVGDLIFNCKLAPKNIFLVGKIMSNPYVLL